MGEQTTVTVHILEKEYLIACPEDEREALRDAARHLDQKMRQIRSTGKIHGLDRIAVMAALNITHELMQKDRSDNMHREIAVRLANSVDLVLQEIS